MLDSRGREVKRAYFPSGGSYSSPEREGSFSLHGDRVTRLGTNMYVYLVPHTGEEFPSLLSTGSWSRLEASLAQSAN